MAFTLYIVLAVLLFPIWLPLLLALLSVVVLWIVIGRFFEYPLLSSALFTGTILGLTISLAGKEYASNGGSFTYSNIIFDCGVVSLALMSATLVCGYLYAGRSSPQRFLSLFTLLSSLIYTAVKGGLRHDTAWSNEELALLVLSVLFPAFQAAVVFRLWRHATPESCVKYEGEILRRVCRTPFKQYKVAGMHTLEFGRLPAGTKDIPNPLHEEEATKIRDGRPILVFCHGYMSGNAMYMYNFDDFTADYKVYSLDWLGCGGSDRPKFDCRNTRETEDFFLNALEDWRREMNIDSFVLVGHSMGGYLCAVYTMRHPSRVQHLVLVSPGGVPTYAAVNPKAATGGMVPSNPSNPTPRPIPPWLWSTVSALWDSDVTPGLLVRCMGPLGPWFNRRGVRSRFSRLVLSRPIDTEVLYLMGMYYYHNLASDGSGDYALRHIFAPGAKAREPVGERLLEAATAGTVRMPITFCYGGTHDWMSAGAGRHYAEAFQKLGMRSHVYLISPGGHHLYLESPAEFAKHVLPELELTFRHISTTKAPWTDADLVPERSPVFTPAEQEANGVGTPTTLRGPSLGQDVMRAVATME